MGEIESVTRPPLIRFFSLSVKSLTVSLWLRDRRPSRCAALNLLRCTVGQILDRLFVELQLADFDAALLRFLLTCAFILRYQN